MSATGRERAQRSFPGMGYMRRPDDFYATPTWCTRAIWPHVAPADHEARILDPCCGEGAILRAVHEPFDLYGLELDLERADAARGLGLSVILRDALNDLAWPRAELVITNPPFAFAIEFVKRALAEVVAGGTVAMLLRLNFLAGLSRANFHRAHPADVYVLSRRPSFTGGSTDATEYGWFVWRPGGGARWSILTVEDR